MKKYFFIIFLLTVLSAGKAQVLSPEAKISLLTIGPGDELYSGFGHSALWIFDAHNGIDRVYNYGTFEFNPGFYLKFVQGKLDYLLSVTNAYYFLYNYKEENRTVFEQVLNLSPSQKEEIFKFLENNYLPENRYYRYDFFFDNCSSRLRDVLSITCKDSLQFNLSNNLELSPKQMIDQYLQDKKLQDLGMDIGLGAPSDKKLKVYQYMFLPDYLKWGVDSARIFHSGHWQPLVLKSETLFQGKALDKKGSIFSPAFFCWIIFIIVLFATLFQYKNNSRAIFGDVLWLFFTGLLGCVLIFLWFFTDHTVTVQNWDLWWANPLNGLVAVLVLKKKGLSLLKLYFLVYGFICLMLLVFWNILPEQLNVAIVPLLLTFIARSLYLYHIFRKEKTLHTNEF